MQLLQFAISGAPTLLYTLLFISIVIKSYLAHIAQSLDPFPVAKFSI